jgi:hypothetical protein
VSGWRVGFSIPTINCVSLAGGSIANLKESLNAEEFREALEARLWHGSRVAVLFMQSVGSRPSLTAEDAASAAIDQWVRDQYLGDDKFRPMEEWRPCSVTMTIRIHRSSAWRHLNSSYDAAS